MNRQAERKASRGKDKTPRGRIGGMQDRPREMLVRLVAEHGPGLTDSPLRCLSLLRDHLQGSHDVEVNVLSLALDHGVVEDLRAVENHQPPELWRPQLVQKLRSKM